jgi:hypothetical protein
MLQGICIWLPCISITELHTPQKIQSFWMLCPVNWLIITSVSKEHSVTEMSELLAQ